MEPPPDPHRLSTSLDTRGGAHRLSTSLDTRGGDHRLSSIENSGGAHRLSTHSDGHSGRVQSLFTAPALERSTLAVPDHLHNKMSDISSAKPLEDDKSSLSKVKDQESTGNRLLNMLRKTLKGSETEEQEVTTEVPSLVPFGDVVGCLAVHIKNCRHFSHKIISQYFLNLYIRVSINNIVKSTRIHSLQSANHERTTLIRFDEVKYFSVQVPRRQDDERNNISLELMQYDSTEKNPVFLGSAEVHLYEVIQKGCFTEELQMLNKNAFACRLEVEFMFSYGNFGYGFSHQLKPLQKIIEPSMFMNVVPPPDRKDPVTNVITPQAVEYPAFLSPDLKVTIGNPTTKQPSNQSPGVRLEKLEQQPRERLEKMKKEYRNLDTWMKKADYLENILNPKLEPKISEEYSTDGSQTSDPYEDKTENITLDVPLKNNESEITTSEWTVKDSKEDLTTPTLNPPDQDYSITVVPKSVEPTPTDVPLSTSPSLKISEGYKITPLEEKKSKTKPEEKMKKKPFHPEVAVNDRHQNILESNSPEVKVRDVCINPERMRRRNLDYSPTKIRWQSNYLTLAERKSTNLASPDSKLKDSFQSQDPEELKLSKV